MDCKLPGGFHWHAQRPDRCIVEHTASGKRYGFTNFTGEPLPDLTKEIERGCTELLHRVEIDELWVACGGDKELFAKRRESVLYRLQTTGGNSGV